MGKIIDKARKSGDLEIINIWNISDNY
jgi:hypothetical protein